MTNIRKNDGERLVEQLCLTAKIDAQELDALIARCVAQAMHWRLPPKWSGHDWREELYSQANLACIEAAPQYDESLGVPFTAYLWQKIISNLLNRYRQEWRYACRCPEALHEAIKGLKNGEIDFEQLCVSADIEQAIAQLSAGDQQLLRQIFWEGYTETEIARQINISQRAVNKRKKRALKTLANLLKIPDFPVR